MIRLRLLIPVFLMAAFTVFAQDAEDCHRPPTYELMEFKDAYAPVEFMHESFSWEVADVVVLAILLAVASFLSVRHSAKCRFTALTVAALAYFGIFRGGCICPVGSTANFCMGLAAPEMIGKVVAVLFLLPLITAFFFGRVFCTSACPLGAIQHLLSRKKAYQIPPRLLRFLRILPVCFLAATAWGALRSGIFLACKLDVYKPLFFAGHAWIGQLIDFVQGTGTENRILWAGDVAAWSLLILAVGLGYFIHRPFCRLVCPYSVLLGIFASIGLRRRSIDPTSCFSCVQCTKTCPTQAISADFKKRTVKVSNFHCVQCGRCDETCKADSLLSPSPYPGSHFPNIGKNKDGNRLPFKPHKTGPKETD
ncbi:MAG: 4Fe-4S binding protein [Pontiellaceae bacterium]|nr:4Fe-4S binding protein [Pontiellaceae bacterium]MBN2784706.1 4Fe-4S binding protein [Pontiellaceae bacterium]